MARSLLEITATVSSEIVFDNKSNAEVGQILEYFILDHHAAPPEGLTQTELNNWKLEVAHRKIIRYVMEESARLRLQERRRAVEQTLVSEVEEETKLVGSLAGERK